MSFRYVSTGEALEGTLEALRTARRIGVDTEFERVRTYYPKLCLVQLALDDDVTCIDALAPLDLAPLWQALADTPGTKILHAGRQDLELIHHESVRTLAWSTLPAPLVDTQVAAGMLGIDEQISYGSLVERELGLGLAKAQTRTDWTRRPLTAEQLAYAADDVRYLIPLWEVLEARLEKLGRLDWVADECAGLSDARLLEPEVSEAWRRVKGARRLASGALALLKRLATWREVQAMKRDKPRQWILRDEVLVALAERRPASTGALRAIRGMPKVVADRYADSLLELMADESAASGENAPAARSGVIPDESVVRLLLERLREIAREAAICPSMIATRRELERLAAGRRDLRLLEGWRYELAGRTLAAMADEQAAPTGPSPSG